MTAFGGSAGQPFTQNIQLKARAGAPTQPAATVAAEEIDPDVPAKARERYRKGLKSAADDKPEEAVRLFQEAVKARERFYVANLALAEQLSTLQRYNEALAAYQKACELKPDRADAYIGIGAMLISQKRKATSPARARTRYHIHRSYLSGECLRTTRPARESRRTPSDLPQREPHIATDRLRPRRH